MPLLVLHIRFKYTPSKRLVILGQLILPMKCLHQSFPPRKRRDAQYRHGETVTVHSAVISGPFFFFLHT